MPDYKDILKKGWHPEKSGASIKGSVKSLVGRGDDKSKYEHHTARPLSSLKDPSSFAPPPKRTNTGSLSNPAGSPTLPQQQEQPTAQDEPPKPPKPRSLNTTGLSTANLPPPPARRDVPSRPSSTSSAGGVPLPPARYSPDFSQAPRAPPALPPRLPPRSPPTTGGNALASLTQSISAASINDRTAPVSKPNQGAIDRLSAAGISVPGLGIGGTTTSQPPPPPRTSSPVARQSPQIPAGLSSHLAKAATSTFAQKHQQQSQESGSGARSGGYEGLAKAGLSRYNSATPEQKTALHGAAKEGFNRYQSATPEQKAAVQGAAASAARGGLDRYNNATPEQKAAVQGAATSAARSGINRYQTATPEQKAAVSGAATSMFSGAVAAAKKKPPPPPPAKKPQFLSNRATQEEEAPPPIPLGTRPF
ncbi:hypothetical protein QBC36DRAFT_321060 [Triangularia setosa]|uniref:Uncharacterized protein n=1 Tax=Triangularia setosa TaxID=2587417 RepID=A0AAN6WH46_9PEZI|nr:hypothetical protein QBC36DRAFT_321060 [Podospora setosa]